MRPRIIDLHAHVVAPDRDGHPPAGLPGTGAGEMSFERLVAEMDAAGIDKAALVQCSSHYGHDNSYVMECVARAPRRFAGIGSVDLLAPDAAARIAYWCRRGMGGLRVRAGTAMSGPEGGGRLTDPRLFPVWEQMADLGMPAELVTSADGLPLLEEVLERFPDVNFVLDHLGRCDLRGGAPFRGAAQLFAMSRFANLYLKLTPEVFDAFAGDPGAASAFLPRLVAAFGADRLAFGSNFPARAGPLRRLVEQGHACLACLGESDRAWIWARTAETLYPALSDAAEMKAINA